VAALGFLCACTLVAAAILVVDQPHAIPGSGNIITETRPVGRFERVSLSDLGTVMISHSDNERLLVVTDDNLMRHVETGVRGGTLVLRLDSRARGGLVQPSKGITYHLSVRDIAGLEVADSGHIQAPALDVGYLEITAHDFGDVVVESLIAQTVQAYVEDSGDVDLTGWVERQEVVVEDSGRYLARQLESREAAVTVSDSAEATLWTTEELDVTAADQGRVQYYGDPRRTQRLSDDATLARLGEP
jgi:hypothetical protein